MTCCVCTKTEEPAAIAGPVAICSQCGFTCHIDDAGTVTRATIKQIEALTDAQVGTLRGARVPLVRRGQGR